MKNRNIPYLFFSYTISKKFKEPDDSKLIFNVLKLIENKAIACSSADEEDTYVTGLTEFESYGIEGFYLYIVKKITEREKIRIENGRVIKEIELTDEDKYNFLFFVPSLSLFAIQDTSSNYKLSGKSSANKLVKLIDSTEYQFNYDIKEPFYDLDTVFRNLQNLEFISFEVTPTPKTDENFIKLLIENKARITGKLIPQDSIDNKFSEIDKGIIRALKNTEELGYANLGFKGITEKGSIISVPKANETGKTRAIKVYIKDFPETEEHLMELCKNINILFQKE